MSFLSLVKYCFLSALLFFAVNLKAQHLLRLQQGRPISIRGLSIVDDKTAWVSGSKGFIALTNDSTKTWTWRQVKGFEQADFRSIVAFSDKEAIIMSSGTPALILKTIDGGNNWQVKYKNTDTAYFFDAMDFIDASRGFILGDPIAGKFLLLETEDSGETWHTYKNLPVALPGEAAFAASGTCLRAYNNNLKIVTGGFHSRLINILTDNSYALFYTQLPIKHGKQSQGAFSIANGNCQVIVGGDYKNDKLTDSVAGYQCSNDNNSLHLPDTPPAGYQSCVEYIGDETFISTGTPGTNLTNNGGKTWHRIDDDSYNVCRLSKHGKLILLAGNDGKIAIFKE